MDAQRSRDLLEAERERLLRLRAGLERERLDETEREATAEMSVLDQHPADIASELFERETELWRLHQVEADLAEVTDALGRLEHGAYGTCATCGAPIDDERLAAVPATRYCATHEARYEDAPSLRLEPAEHDFGLFIDESADEELGLSAEELALHVLDPEDRRGNGARYDTAQLTDED